jgi:Predicted nuclease of the RecB family
MPIEVGIWRIDSGTERVPFSSLETERRLEDVLQQDISLLDPTLMVLGRQVRTSSGKLIDLLAIDAQGDMVVVELKRAKTPREVVAQVLDYASWVDTLGYDAIVDLYAERNGGKSFADAFTEHFEDELPERLNTGHRLVIVASELDHESERIINYLSTNYGVPINAVFFRYFKSENAEYLARTWLIDPEEAEVQSAKAVASKRVHGDWNGTDYFVNVGESANRSWDDYRKYGFVAAGQSRWAKERLAALPVGMRAFAYMKGIGYVGVGVVMGPPVRVKDYRVKIDGVERLLLEVPLAAPRMGENADDPERSEYVVPMRWEVTVPRDQAFKRPGLFANQNIACKLRDAGTLDQLVKRFGVPAEFSRGAE